MTSPSGSTSTAAGDRRTGYVAFWTVGVVVVGIVAAAAAIAVAMTSHQQGEYALLGQYLVGLAAGIGVAVLGWAVLLVLVVRRYVPDGKRFLAAVTALGAVLGLAVAVFVLGRGGGTAGAGAIGWAGTVVVPAAAVAPPFVVGAFRRTAFAGPAGSAVG